MPSSLMESPYIAVLAEQPKVLVLSHGGVGKCIVHVAQSLPIYRMIS